MPKYGIHQVVLNEAIQALQDSGAGSVAGLLRDHPTAAMLGAIGPDLFFWAPDYEIGSALYTFYSLYSEAKSIYDTVMKPLDDAEEAIKQVGDQLTPHTVRMLESLGADAQRLSADFRNALMGSLFVGVIDGVDGMADVLNQPSVVGEFFKLFSPPLQPVPGSIPSLAPQSPETQWYWFDMLHYRRTGDFARRLVELAPRGRTVENRERRMAFALGYLSHIATDLVGHAYVNQVVGGPYRLQLHRHITVENFMDTWAFERWYGENITPSLMERLALEPGLDANAINAWIEDNADLRNLMFAALRDQEVYRDPVRRPDSFLTREQLDQTLTNVYLALDLMRQSSIQPPVEPFEGVLDILESLFDDLFEPAPNVSPTSPVNLDQWAEWVLDFINWASETLQDLFDALLALGVAALAIVAQAIIYGIRLVLYEIYQEVRWALARFGFVYPEPGNLNNPLAQSLIRPVQCGIQGCLTGTDLWLYPRRQDRTVNQEWGQLECSPSSALERLQTSPNTAEQSPSDLSPAMFMNEEPFSEDALLKYSVASLGGTEELWRDCVRIGNARDLSAWMMIAANGGSHQERKIAFTNWNLDSDRGYAYKTWNGRIRVFENDGSDQVEMSTGDIREYGSL